LFVILIAFCIVGKLDNLNQETITVKQYAGTHKTLEVVELKADYTAELAPIIMSAAGNQTYKGKYLVACVLRNRVEKYGLESVLTSGHVEKPYIKPKGLSEWQSEQIDKQYQDCVKAVNKAYETQEYADLLYYCNPKISSQDGLEFFNKLTFVIAEGEHKFYKED